MMSRADSTGEEDDREGDSPKQCRRHRQQGRSGKPGVGVEVVIYGVPGTEHNALGAARID
jgi:hypothetical protein